MASRYSLSAEMPPTRKSMHRNRRIVTGAPDEREEEQDPRAAFQQYQREQQQRERQRERDHFDTARGEKIQLTDIPQPQSQQRLAGDKQLAASPVGAEKVSSAPDRPATDARGYKVLHGKERWGLTPKAFTADASNDEGRKRSTRIGYLEGLRGVLGIQTLLWIFFRLFAPAIVTETDFDGVQPAPFIASSPQWMTIIRKVLSPVLFDGNLQMTFFIILCGRTVLNTFLERREISITLSGPAFRRPFRMMIPIIATLTIVSIVNVAGGFSNATRLADVLNNELARPAPIWSSAIEYFNSLVFYFFTPLTYHQSRATEFIPPAGIMWFLAVVFQQVYVLIVYAWVMPYTLMKYKNFGLPLLIVASAWVGVWSWFTLTGLAIAEYSLVYLPLLPPAGIPLDRLGRRHMPTWLVPLSFVLVGFLLKYLWVAAFPGSYGNDYIAHANSNTGKLNWNFDWASLAYPRWDNWLVATGALALIEISPRLQRLLASKPVRYTGRWSFSIALLAGTVMQSVGSTLFVHLHDSLGWRSPAAITGVLFITMIPACLVVAEVFSRLVDDSAIWAARFMFRFIRT